MDIDCQKCGLCCLANRGQKGFVPIAVADYKKIPRVKRKSITKLTFFEQVLDQRLRGFDYLIDTKYVECGDGTPKTGCVFLDGSVGKDCHCAIYQERPEICKTGIVPGDKWCKYLRKMNKKLLR